MTAAPGPGAPAPVVHPSSFRDPSGQVYRHEGELYRRVDPSYREHYDLLLSSGLYDELVEAGLLVAHEEAPPGTPCPGEAYKVLRPRRVPFVSYPYEWCFGQLQDAALLTLEVQRRALARGLWLKDASAFNVQFLAGRPLLIDTLSFERYPEGRPWPAYRQLCQHFLVPLALMARVDPRLGLLLRDFLDGIPLDLGSRLLPWGTRLRYSLLAHVHLHAASQRRYADRPVAPGSVRLGRAALTGLIESLASAVRAQRWEPGGTEWADYDGTASYAPAAAAAKERAVADLFEELDLEVLWDLGANDGAFSRVARRAAARRVVAIDGDPGAVERNYRRCRADGEEGILPLLVDLTNPTPGLGWASRERDGLLARGPADAALALALVHHLAIGSNVPLGRVADLLAEIAPVAVVEWVPKDDPMVARLLAGREDVFPGYTEAGFEAAFGRRFAVEARAPLEGSGRVLYRLRRREAEASA